MMLERIPKGTDTLLDGTFPPLLWLGRGWFALGDVFMRASE
jgi:hypothetical protein